MKSRLIIPVALAFILAGLFAAPAYAKDAPKPDHFAAAEALAALGKADAALKEYRAYLKASPTGSMAPAAWLKIAAISSGKNDVAAAREAYRAVVSRFGDSLYAPDAKLGLVDCLLREGRFKEALDEARPLAAPPNSERVRAAALVMAGSANTGLERPVQALDAFDQALSVGRELNRAQVLSKVEKAALLLEPNEQGPALSSAQNCMIQGVLGAVISERLLSEGNSAAAKDTASRVLSRCPSNERASRLKAVINGAQRSLDFNPASFGVLLPLTGSYAQHGNSILAGVELAVSQFNSLRPERTVTLIVRDSGSTAEGTRLGFSELAAAGVAAVIGPMTSADVLKKTTRDLEIPAIVFTQKEGVTAPGSYLFRNYVTLPMISQALAAYGVKSAGLKTFAVIHPNDSYGALAAKSFRQAVKAAGGTISCVRPYDPKMTDFSDVIEGFLASCVKPAKAHPPSPRAPLPALTPAAKPVPAKPVFAFDAVFIPDKPSTSGLIISQLFYYGVKKPVFGTNAWHSGKLAEVAGNATEGAVIADIFFRDSQRPEVREFMTDFTDANGRPPGFLEALGYDSAMILFRAAATEGVRSGKMLRKALVGASFGGVTGSTYFDDKGEVHKDLVILKVTNGGFDEVPGPGFFR
ncbi:MAG: penicillin-binding protein activator [Deltaproteobacteria bacterium]|nr:penicillin-binding protein activator [Deltaproteobacteria bacterium]